MCALYRQWMKSEIDGVLVSVQSEVDGNKAECVRNELWALFDVWVGWGEQHRHLGREIMIDKLYEDGVRLATHIHVGCCGGQGRVIVWRGRRVERMDYGEAGRNAARNGMVALLRRELYARGGGAGELRKFKARARANRHRSVVPTPRHLRCRGAESIPTKVPLVPIPYLGRFQPKLSQISA
jgi:hypothetical protein